ncbi:hypothetical protein C7I87_23525 [Mesorhizobium sp. SARCC-RB16n]|uniref:ATP-grasp domain-containing protein n=1 Tax=Mesorhizobium sp. SARCC-RB16n TaxID=2116687 RepID=UPI00122EF393|nr:acetyl-CoA carboxylase biotin carboxylase subunit family protein [Mesorhizobium sp. SARCC-RB16n]KAA3447940.1 hypothetical protein C7I87_23525 [Mesorhizobium sp. SARCC-RB16n]
MQNKALVLVEGHMSIGLLYVKVAKNLGLHPIAMAADSTQYDYLEAEGVDTIHVDTNDIDALTLECSRLSQTWDIAGITGFTGLDESVYARIGRLCQHFKLPGPNPASVETCCDKFTQRQLLAEAGVPMPAFSLAADATEVQSSAAQIGLPVVLKPAVGSGSSGVRLCSNVDELGQHTAYLLGKEYMWEAPRGILVEEFAQGPHYSVEIMGNEVIAIGAADFDSPPHFVCREYTYPAPLSDQQYERIADISLNCLRTLGCGWGPANIDLRWTKLGPVVIEVNPRLAGGPIPRLVQLAYGIDLIREHIKLAVGVECNLRKRHSHTASARCLIPDRDGILNWIGGDREAASLPGVNLVKLDVKSNMTILRKGDYRDSIGCVIAASPTHAQTASMLQSAVDLLQWSITPVPNPPYRE